MKNRLTTTVLLIIGAYFFFLGLSKAGAFLLPIIFAILFAMLMAPLAGKLEKLGLGRGLAAFICVLLIIGFFTGLFFLVSMQVSEIAADLPNIKQHIEEASQSAVEFLEEKTGIKIKDPVSSFFSQSGSMMSSTKDYFLTIMGLLGSSLLVLVYTFFFLLFRSKFKEFLLKMTEDKAQMKEVIIQSGEVAQNYLVGRVILITMLTILYSIGLVIIGIPHAFIIGIIAAVLSIIPYIGNIMGAGIAVSMGFISGGGVGAALGVVAVFSITQFIDTYFFEPYVLGHEVGLDPLWTIIFVILGEAVWGVAGMVVALPLMGIVKVVMDHVKTLKPYGWLIGDTSGDTADIFNKIKEKVSGMFEKKK